IVGAVFGTVIANAASAAVALPSLTEITTFEYVAAFAATGVPCKRPVVVLKVAQVGLFAIVKVSGSLSASAAVGWNAYCTPCGAEVDGEPLMVGGLFSAGAVTVIANAASDALNLPSLTEITMFENVPVVPVGGVPDN